MQNVLTGDAIDPKFERKEAVRLCRLALSIDDGDPETLAFAAVISAFMIGDCESEIEMADRAVALNPNSFTAWGCRGWVYEIAGLPEEAVRSFERANRVSPVDPQLHQSLLALGWPLLSLVALTRPLSQGRKPYVRTAPIRQLTSVSRPLLPISDVTRRRVRRRLVCLRSIPPSQYPRGWVGADKHTRSC
jgi:adenylate cyclase